MKYETFSNNPEFLDPEYEVEQGVTLEHFGIKEQIEVSEINEASDAIYGNPETDAKNWHHQTESVSCAVACQEFIVEQLTGQEYYEHDLIQYAENLGWYDPESGTSIKDVGNILEAAGLLVERGEQYTLNDLAEELESGGKVICGVNNKILQNPMYSLVPGLRANHAVQVSGIDASDPNNVEVILNDPGVINGRGLRVPADTFMKAWGTGDNFAVFARKGVTV
ncbi:MAG: hypothetical protein Q4B26_17855 [Eubacteriales bacterium]|nr:hypothetical protein [Eubacteriales bacterium]